MAIGERMFHAREGSVLEEDASNQRRLGTKAKHDPVITGREME